MKQAQTNELNGMRTVELNGERVLELDGLRVIPTSLPIQTPCLVYSLPNSPIGFKYLFGSSYNCYYMHESSIKLLLNEFFDDSVSLAGSV